MNIVVKPVAYNSAEYHEARMIREEVFIKEQRVPAEEEYDEYEPTSIHFVAYIAHSPAGTARWRLTKNGVKLERFAVLAEYRSQGVGSELVKAVLADIAQDETAKGKMHYLHSQVDAVPLYAKFGFQPEGNPFDECGIMHYLMKLPK